MRVLLTGATGFVGRYLAQQLLDSGHDLAILVPPTERLIARELFAQHPGVHLVIGTMASVPWRLVADFAPSTCIHLAWITTPDEYLDSPYNLRHLNWSQSFIRHIVKAGVRRIVVTGTCAEHTRYEGTTPPPLYVQSKIRLWKWLQDQFRCTENDHDEIAIAWARLFHPYGPGESPKRLISSLITTFRKRENFLLRCPTTAKDYIHIRDVASALVMIASTNYSGAVDVGTGSAVTLGSLASQVATMMNCRELLELGNEEDRLGDLEADIAPLRRLGWQSQITLEEGLRDMVCKIN